MQDYQILNTRADGVSPDAFLFPGHAYPILQTNKWQDSLRIQKRNQQIKIMKHIFLTAIIIISTFTASAQTLVVYYSRTGQNYTSDGIVNLKVGNTQMVHDWTGKTVIPFTTHEGSGFGSGLRDLKAAIPAATIPKGLSIQGSKVKTAAAQIEKFVSEQK